MTFETNLPMAGAVAPSPERAARARRPMNPWLKFLARRGRHFLVSLAVVLTAAFLMMRLVPGDPVRAALGPTAPAELVEARRNALGLNDPLWLQFVNYLRGLVTGEWGESMITGVPVTQIIGDRLPATAALAVLAFITIMIVSVPLGVVVAALTRGGRRRATELSFTSTTAVLAAIPEFLIAVALVYVFAVSLGLLPVAGRGGPESYVLPVIALSLGPAAFLSRLVRIEMLVVLQSDFIRTARAKRLPIPAIYLRHALPNAVTTTLTVGGLMLGGLIAGTVLVENVFAWPGLGSSIVNSIVSKDYPVAQGIVLVYGVLVLVINLVVDLVIAIIDPRSTIAEG